MLTLTGFEKIRVVVRVPRIDWRKQVRRVGLILIWGVILALFIDQFFITPESETSRLLSYLLD